MRRPKSPPQIKETSPSYPKNYIIIIALSILPFLANINGDFVFDDAESVVRNPVVNGKLPLQEIFRRDFWGRTLTSANSHKSFRPVTTFSFWLNHMIHGSSPLGYHILNVSLHSLVTILLYNLCTKLEAVFNLKSIALPTAIAFAVHPIHTEAVANITGRAELLCAVFYLLAILIEPTSFLNFGYIIFFSVLSIFSKEQGIATLPTIIFLQLLKSNKSAKTLGFLSVATILLAYFRWSLNGGPPVFREVDNAAVFAKDPLFRWSSIAWQWLYHLFLLIFPVQLCFDYSMGCIPTVKSFTDPRILSFPAVIFLGISCLVWIRRLRENSLKRLCSFALFSPLVAFFPASNIIVNVGFSVAERVLYLPSIGYCILLGILYQHMSVRMRNHELIGFAIVLISLSHSYQRSSEWSDELSLYSSGLRVCPTNAKIHYNLAKVMADKGESEIAEREYWEALRLNPTYENALNNLGNILERTGRLKDSESVLRTAVRLRPNFASAWMNLGITLMKKGNFRESTFAFENSLQLRPNSADNLFNYGNLLKAQGLLDSAVNMWFNATRIEPTHMASWTNLFLALDELGRCAEVIRLGNEALIHNKGNPSIHSQLGACLAQVGESEKAEEHLKTAANLKPEVAEHHANLGVLYQRLGRLSEARKAYSEALKIDPTSDHVIDYISQLDRRQRTNSTIAS